MGETGTNQWSYGFSFEEDKIQIMKKLKYILFSLSFLYVSCSERETVPAVIDQLDQGNAVSNERISILNERITISGSNTQNSEPASMAMAISASPSFDCSEVITSDFSGNKKVDNKKTVCLAEGVSFSGTVELKGGTFVVNGDAIITGVNGNKGKIVVTETGSLTLSNLTINNNFEVENYSNALDINDITVSGEFINHGNITVSSVSVNGGGDFKNTGEMIIQNNFTASNDIDNEGKMTVKGDLTINGGVDFENDCQLIVEGNLQNNKTLKNKGYVRVDGSLTVNGGAKVELDEQTYLIATNLILSGSIEGENGDYARVDILGTSTINWGSKITKKIDFNDADGIEVKNGNFDSDVTFDQAISINETACNPGSIAPLLNPAYTLVADIAVPSQEGNVLSATDVFFNDDFAFISYHLNGAEFSGAIDMLNLTSVNSPSFSMNYINSVREFNALAVSNDKVYLAGQRNIDESGYTDNGTKGATLFIADILGGNVLEEPSSWEEIPMPSFSGNGVHLLSENQLLFASGATGGGFFEVNTATDEISKSEVKDYAKYVSGNDNYKLKLVGGFSNAKLLVETDGSQKEIDLGVSAIPENGKNVIAYFGNTAYITLGSNGIVVVDLERSEVLKHYMTDKVGLTNGVAVDDDFVYLANGESGLLLLRRESLEFYGQYKYDGSANSVEVFDNVILIANGTGGVKLLIRTE